MLERAVTEKLPTRWQVRGKGIALDLRRDRQFQCKGATEAGRVPLHSVATVSGYGFIDGRTVEFGGCAAYFDD